METSKIAINMLLVCGIVVASIVALPYLTNRLSRPVWAIPKTIAEFVALWLLCSQLIPWILALGVATVLAMFRYQARLARYKRLLASEADDTAVQTD